MTQDQEIIVKKGGKMSGFCLKQGQGFKKTSTAHLYSNISCVRPPTPPPPPPSPSPSPFPFGYFLRPYPQFSVISDSYLKSVRAWSWFGAVEQFTFRCCSPWETFPREHHVKLWDGTKLTQFAESASSSIVLYMYSRFILLNGSNTLIRAETWDRYDIIPFSKVTTKSLASATGS